MPATTCSDPSPEPNDSSNLLSNFLASFQFARNSREARQATMGRSILESFEQLANDSNFTSLTPPNRAIVIRQLWGCLIEARYLMEKDDNKARISQPTATTLMLYFISQDDRGDVGSSPAATSRFLRSFAAPQDREGNLIMRLYSRAHTYLSDIGLLTINESGFVFGSGNSTVWRQVFRNLSVPNLRAAFARPQDLCRDQESENSRAQVAAMLAEYEGRDGPSGDNMA